MFWNPHASKDHPHHARSGSDSLNSIKSDLAADGEAAEDDEEEDEEGISIYPPENGSLYDWVWYLVTIPMVFLFVCTIADVKKPGNQCHVMSCNVLSCPCFHVLSCPVLSCLCFHVIIHLLLILVLSIPSFLPLIAMSCHHLILSTLLIHLIHISFIINPYPTMLKTTNRCSKIPCLFCIYYVFGVDGFVIILHGQRYVKAATLYNMQNYIHSSLPFICLIHCPSLSSDPLPLIQPYIFR